jgi:hypothetical protein
VTTNVLQRKVSVERPRVLWIRRAARRLCIHR